MTLTRRDAILSVFAMPLMALFDARKALPKLPLTQRAETAGTLIEFDDWEGQFWYDPALQYDVRISVESDGCATVEWRPKARRIFQWPT